ncbi:hypothetical protein ACLUXD_01345 [Loigolactobacillus coryniformis subsp. coryniformis]|uniref:hypothetical protein n=1 Tax=Loigolactobacillus coryniformis TaxID=1610 RepID=UPI001C605CD2|nr:hypothetical protein [Loigolactobacillus coryniformis]MBW4802659.1 hypothetical protein [Loigolactobacillus coryniformis subsp. torquens]MBW4805356.1 hypothetical protein [Loigolactobacillus coryniformis subsp. torquens]
MTTITIIVGGKKYKPTADYTASDQIAYYPFNTAAFIPTPLTPQTKSYRRLMAFLLGRPQIEAKLRHIERNFTTGQLLRHFKRQNIYFALASDREQIHNFLAQHPEDTITLLLLGKKTWSCATEFTHPQLETLLFTAPHKKDSFWCSLDYQDQSGIASTSTMQKLIQPKIRL